MLLEVILDVFLLFMVASAGMCHIIVDGSIFNSFKLWLAGGDQNKASGIEETADEAVIEEEEEEEPKEKKEVAWWKTKLLQLMNCYQCAGFWSGAFIGLLFWLFGLSGISLDYWYFKALPLLFIYGCAGAFASMVGAVLIVFLQSR